MFEYRAGIQVYFAFKLQYLLKPDQLSAAQPLILTFGRMSNVKQHKDYERRIQVPTIIQAIPNTHYLIVGKGDDCPHI